MSQLFHIFNTKNAPFRGTDAPLSKAGWAQTTSIFSEAWKILTSLTDCNGTPVYQTPRHTAIHGLCGNILVIQLLVGQLGDVIRLEYILFYRACQDHIEVKYHLPV